MQRGTDKLLFSYVASGNVVSVDFNGMEYYYLRNAQGDIVKLIDASGASVVEYTYDTWGKEVQTTGSLAGTLGSFQPFRYRGYVYDEETGLYYLQSRYYDPTTGRFISADTLLSTGQGVLGHNAFAYCRDNPSSRFDPEGKEDEDVNDNVYIIYTNYSSEENDGNDAGDFTEQAKYYAEITGCPEENMIAIQTVDDFIEAWNIKIGNAAGSVYIFSHGNGMSLIFLHGEGISATGYNKKGEAIDAIRDLSRKCIHDLYLMSCNSGHRDLYDKKGTNAAAAFVRLGGTDRVHAFDGSMSYNRVFNRKARLSFSQHGFYAVYEDFHIVKQHPEPSGWVVYVPA